jgi:hypothetical protein
MVCFRYTIVNTLHKGDNKGNNNNNNKYYNYNNNNNGLSSGQRICLHPLQGHVMRIYNLPMLKTVHAWWRITSYKRWPCWLTEHGRSRGVNQKRSSSPKCKLLCWGTTHSSVVEARKLRMVNIEKWRPSTASSLTVAGGNTLQKTEDIPS